MKKGKYATAPKANKNKVEEPVEKAEDVSPEGKAARALAAANSSRLGRPVPEMYPDIVCTFGTNISKVCFSIFYSHFQSFNHVFCTHIIT